MQTPQLYYAPGACSLAPHILLHDVGLPIDLVEVGFGEGLSTLESVQALNPKRQVPILILEGETITESTAIMTAIAQLKPELKLLGTTNLETVRVYEWMNFLSGSLHGQAFGALFRPNRFSNDTDMYDAIKAKGFANAVERFRLIEDKLEGEHAVGNSYTIVDPFLYVFWRWGVQHKMLSEITHPRYATLVSKILLRESVQKALSTEGQRPLEPASN